MVLSGPTAKLSRSMSLCALILSATLLAMPACSVFKGPVDEAKKITTAVELAAAPAGTAVIRAGGEDISRQEIRDAFMDLFAKPSSEDTYESVTQSSLEIALSRHYLYLEAKRLNLDVDPEIAYKWKMLTHFWIGDNYLQRQAADFTVDPEVLDAFVPEGAFAFKLSQISTFDLAATQDLRMRVEEGMPFEDVARQYSADPSAPRGGEIRDWQVMALGNIYGDEILGRLVKVEPGQVSEIIPTPMGYTFFRVDEKRPLTEEEKVIIRTGKERDLQSGMVRSFISQVVAKHPLSIEEEIIESALSSNDPDVKVGQVGDFDISVKFLRGFALYLMTAVDRPTEDTAQRWVPIMKLMHQGLALGLEARNQGMADDEAVMENLARVRKYSLANSMTLYLARENEPTPEELFSYYMEEFVPEGTEGIFSVMGYDGLTGEAAQEINRLLEEGVPIDDIDTRSALVSGAKQMSGTYSDGDFDAAVRTALELTAVGKVTPPIETGSGWAVYRLDGKRRGEAPPYDQVTAFIKARYMQEQSSDKRTQLIIEKSKSAPPVYVVPREVIDEVIGQWLDMQKALRGVSPPGGYHQRGGPNQIDMPGGSKPAGHPGGGGGKRPSGHP
ncbi:MAG: peptidyl-prolyl cis-trans isomerase [bacterium]|nr:peptidyl-prolyl cis-trans isomerase [bacterium]